MTKSELIAKMLNSPLRVCQSLHSCFICTGDITLGQKYFDRGYNRRAHEDCVRSANASSK